LDTTIGIYTIDGTQWAW